MTVHPDSETGNDAHNPLDSFTDREDILTLFRRILRSAQAGHLHLVAIKGNSGTGKTFLISYLLERVCPLFPWQAGAMSFAQSTPDFRTILLGLEHALKGGVPPPSLNRFRAERNEYNRHFDEYKAAITIGTIQQHLESRDQSSISNSSQSIQINTQLHERELHLRSELTRALLELAEESEHPLCLFVDGYERLTEAAPELIGWFWEEVVPGLANAIPHPFQVITCGWQWPSNAAIEPFMQRAELTDFDVEQVKGFLEKQEAIPSSTDPAPAEREELISAFYDLTQGHPLVLGLAVTYFKHLPPTERTAVSLRANAPLIDSRARVEFLEQRLLERLPEPDRTLLERGPILRSLDQAALQALLSIEREGTEKGRDVFDDATYDRFLRYPFINRESRVERGSQEIQPTFHELVRRVQVETLRRRPDHLKDQLHRTMVDYYQGRVERERVRTTAAGASRPGRELEQSWFRRMRNKVGRMWHHPSKKTSGAGASREEPAVWLVEMSEPAFRAHVEYLYHALQLRVQQDEAFAAWETVMGQTINGWRRQEAETLLELIEQLVEEGEPFLSAGSEPYGYYLLWSARFLVQDLQWQEAQTVLNKAAQVFEQGRNQASYSTALNNLAELYRAQGNYEQAEPLMKRALAICEQVLGPLHPNTASSLNNLAALYDAQGNYEQAEPLYQRALAIREEVLGPLHPDTASSLNNLALLYDAQGNYEQAEPLMKRALAMREQVLGPLHPDTAQSLNNLAGLYRAQGHYAQAEPLMKRALAICEQVLGPLHPDTAGSLNNLALLYNAQGHYEQAEPLYQRALAMREQVLGPLHPDTATSLNNLAALYDAQGNYEQAEPLYQRALAIWEQMLGPLHPNTATSLNNLAELYRAQGNYAQAEPLYQRALAIYEQVLGPRHPDTAQSLNNLALLYYAQGNYEQAEPLLKRALAIYEQVLGPRYPDTASSLNNLAGLYDAQGHYEQAEPLYQRALAMREQVLGLLHPDTAQSLNNLAALYYAQGNYEQAEPLMKRALAIYEQVLGPLHPDTATTRANYTFLLEEMTERKTEGAGLQDEGSQP